MVENNQRDTLSSGSESLPSIQERTRPTLTNFHHQREAIGGAQSDGSPRFVTELPSAFDDDEEAAGGPLQIRAPSKARALLRLLLPPSVTTSNPSTTTVSSSINSVALQDTTTSTQGERHASDPLPSATSVGRNWKTGLGTLNLMGNRGGVRSNSQIQGGVNEYQRSAGVSPRGSIPSSISATSNSTSSANVLPPLPPLPPPFTTRGVQYGLDNSPSVNTPQNSALHPSSAPVSKLPFKGLPYSSPSPLLDSPLFPLSPSNYVFPDRTKPPNSKIDVEKSLPQIPMAPTRMTSLPESNSPESHPERITPDPFSSDEVPRLVRRHSSLPERIAERPSFELKMEILTTTTSKGGGRQNSNESSFFSGAATRSKGSGSNDSVAAPRKSSAESVVIPKSFVKKKRDILNWAREESFVSFDLDSHPNSDLGRRDSVGSGLREGRNRNVGSVASSRPTFLRANSYEVGSHATPQNQGGVLRQYYMGSRFSDATTTEVGTEMDRTSITSISLPSPKIRPFGGAGLGEGLEEIVEGNVLMSDGIRIGAIERRLGKSRSAPDLVSTNFGRPDPPSPTSPSLRSISTALPLSPSLTIELMNKKSSTPFPDLVVRPTISCGTQTTPPHPSDVQVTHILASYYNRSDSNGDLDTNTIFGWGSPQSTLNGTSQRRKSSDSKSIAPSSTDGKSNPARNPIPRFTRLSPPRSTAGTTSNETSLESFYSHDSSLQLSSPRTSLSPEPSKHTSSVSNAESDDEGGIAAALIQQLQIAVEPLAIHSVNSVQRERPESEREEKNLNSKRVLRWHKGFRVGTGTGGGGDGSEGAEAEGEEGEKESGEIETGDGGMM